MAGAYKTIAQDELVKKSVPNSKLTDAAFAAAQQAVRNQVTAAAAELKEQQKQQKLVQLASDVVKRSVAENKSWSDAYKSMDWDSVSNAGDTENTALTVPEFTFGTQVEDYSSYLEQMYAAKKQAAMAELKNAYDNSVAELDRAENGLAEGYQAVRNATAGSHEQERRNFAEFAAANGLNNGAAGQAELTRGVSLQNNMNNIRTAEANAMADLTLQRAEAENEYNAAIAQAEYTGEYELAAALYEEKVRVQEALIEAEIRQQQYALEQYKLQYQAQRDAIADQRYESEQAFAMQKYQDSLALQQAAQALKEKDQADSSKLAWAQQTLKEKDQADSLALSQAQLAQKEQQALAEQLLAQKKQEDAAALDWAAQTLAQKKYTDSLTTAQKTQLADYGELYLKAGVLPTDSMLQAMGITAADARKYIAGLKAGK